MLVRCVRKSWQLFRHRRILHLQLWRRFRRQLRQIPIRMRRYLLLFLISTFSISFCIFLDVNECLEDDTLCGNPERCENIEPFYKCHCPQPYTTSGGAAISFASDCTVKNISANQSSKCFTPLLCFFSWGFLSKQLFTRTGSNRKWPRRLRMQWSCRQSTTEHNRTTFEQEEDGSCMARHVISRTSAQCPVPFCCKKQFLL